MTYNPKGVFGNGEESKTLLTLGIRIIGKIWQGVQ